MNDDLLVVGVIAGAAILLTNNPVSKTLDFLETPIDAITNPINQNRNPEVIKTALSKDVNTIWNVLSYFPSTPMGQWRIISTASGWL